ncbi:hypothetical protein GCM10018793_59290 [Streptomyces sulfonofaciens]|uniref:Uncharacterized protein n=1 Tax=Streptomyces sulfonofaciens TaxID=68272 RepID=A0A919GKS7_9ACTN|nr:hypothetical protein [Streptomyces sulfonofaciens]GHH86615.1 hypothetical protein GCM10018793_59290 [Streptomyces sulfonofaciens]
MRFLLEVDVDDSPTGTDPARELGRILRYWGGNLHHFELRPGSGAAVHDSAYREVGRWSVTGTPETTETAAPGEAGAPAPGAPAPGAPAQGAS